MDSQTHTDRDRDAEIARLRAQVKSLEAELALRKPYPAITDLEAVEPGQRYSQEQMAAILESIPSAVVIIAAESGRFIFANRHASELYGMDYVGMPMDEHAGQVKARRPDGTPYAAEDFPANRSIRNGETVLNDEIIIQQPDGRQLTVLASSAPLYGRQGRIVAAVASFRDITERKQAEAALKAALDTAEARMRELEAVVRSVPDGLAVFGPDRQLVFVNESGRLTNSLFMPPPDPVTGMFALNAYDVTGTRLLPEDEAVSRIFRNGETFHDEVYSTRPDQEPVTWVSLSGAPVRDPDGTIKGAVVLSRDITGHRAIEQTIAFQAHLLENVHDAIVATDDLFRITYWNRQAEALLGWTEHEVLGLRTRDFLNPILTGMSVSEATEKLLDTGLFTGELVYHHKDGTPIPVENWSRLIRNRDGGIRETVTTIRDIRTRKQAENALLESERKYRELVRHAPTGIYEIDMHSRHFLSVNDCMTELTGYSREELLNMDAMALLDEASYQAYLSRMQQWDRGEMPAQNVDYTWVVKDGRHVHVALNTTFIPDENGCPAKMTVIAHDVTGRKQLELALKRQAEELLAADRNKNHFLNMLSHELRNPLAAITASIDLLAHFSPDEERRQRAVRVLHRQAGHLAHLVDDLLDVTRITTGKLRLKKEPVNITSLVGRTASDHQAQFAAKGVALAIDLPDEPVILDADPVRLLQAIANLLHNALKFTQSGGQVAVAARREDKAREIRITIADNGAGISPDILPHLFEPFSQAEQTLARTQGGLGLGLAIAKGMVVLHGGRLEAESKGEGMGAVFTIRLPLA